MKLDKNNKYPLHQTGITTEDKKVVAGIYSFYETYGLPLNIVLMCFQTKDWVPDWIDLYLSATKAGMKHTRILSMLEEAISDSFGKEWTTEVISRLDHLYGDK